MHIYDFCAPCRDCLGKFEDEILMPGCVLLWCIVHVSFYRRYDVGKFNSLTRLEEQGVVSYHESTSQNITLNRVERFNVSLPKHATQQPQGDDKVKERVQCINDHLHRLRQIASSQKVV